ncbi:MAG: hypothetical protein LBP43_00735 [Treponema sp.]|nr:hypothetical protein [Treponema sp.]
MFLVWALLGGLFPLGAWDAGRPEFRPPGRFRSLGRAGPINVNLIIDGSRYMGGTGAQAWVCGRLVDGILQEGDYLSVWIAGDRAAVLYQGVLGADNRELIKSLIQRPLPESPSADFAGALRAAKEAGVPEDRPPVMTYTLLVSSPRGLSPAHVGAALPYLRYSRVLEFPGWRALVIALDISRQVREAADSFLSNR